MRRQAPVFKNNAVIDGMIKPFSSNDLKGKYCYLFFYPLDFTFVCPTEITAFSDRIKEFQDINCQVLAASVDSEYSHLAWCNVPRNQGGLGKISFPLLADVNKRLATEFGALLEEEGDEALRLVKAIKFFDEHGEVCPINWQPGTKTMKATPEESKQYFESISK